MVPLPNRINGIHFLPTHSFLRLTLIIKSNLRPGTPSCLSLTLFHIFLPITCVHFSNFSYILLAPPIQVSFDYSTNFGDGEKSRCSPSCSLFHPSLTSSTLRPNIPLSTLFPNTLTCLQGILRFFTRQNWRSCYIALKIFVHWVVQNVTEIIATKRKSSTHTYKKCFTKNLSKNTGERG